MKQEEKIEKLCPNKFYEDDEIALGEFKTWEEYASFPEKTRWKIPEQNLSDKHIFRHILLFQKQYSDDERFIIFLLNKKNGFLPTAFDMNGTRVNEYTKKGKITKIIKEYYLNSNVIKEEKPAVDISKEAYESSSELFSFKDMRRGVIEHGRACYIEGYKKHSELFSTFLVQNGYFSGEELHKVRAEFDAYLNGTPAISVRTCEDVLEKTKPIVDSVQRDEGYPMPYLNPCQKDIVMHYCDTLTNDMIVLRIKKARQKGVSTILGIIAYLETKNEKSVLYIGSDNPSKKLGLRYNYQYFTYKEYLGMHSEYISKRYDLIIIDDPKYDTLETFDTLACGCLTENGRLIIALTPTPHNEHNPNQNSVYEDIKDFFKRESAVMYTYSTGPSENAAEIIEKWPECRNEVMGGFID